jgi:threonyl-tRNA synthetase
MLHSDYFKFEVVEKTKVSEEVSESEKRGEVNGSVLVVFACSEKPDERNPSAVVDKAIEMIVDIADQIKPTHVVLHSFAHLSDDLARPDVAKRVLHEMHRKLTSLGYECLKTPFGWRDTFELRVKGHPVSKVFRPIRLI